MPDRAYEYARDEKITKALEWRREYGVDALMAAFTCDEGAEWIFRSVQQQHDAAEEDEDDTIEAENDDDDERNHQLIFVPSTYLVNVCLSGVFYFDGFDGDGRGVLRVRSALLDWWRTGVEDGIRYHVLVIEHALKMISEHNKNNDGQEASESMILYVDTSNLSIIPPPLGALTGMARILQHAYPDRIHKMYIGPVNSLLRNLYGIVSPYLRPRSRDKIVLMECTPDREAVEQIS